MAPPAHVLHLASRFFGSLDPRPPNEDDRRWVRRHLTDPEYAIWTAMSNPDQRHSIEVARAVDVAVAEHGRKRHNGLPLRSAAEDGFDSSEQRGAVMVAAALLHDSGKNASRLGTVARVVATVLRPVVPAVNVERWLATDGARRRLALYWRHPGIGGDALADCGSHPLVSAWAAEHHMPATRWTVPVALGRILRDCDND